MADMSSLARLLLATGKSGSTPPPTNDQYFPYVAALAHGNGANNSANNTYTATNAASGSFVLTAAGSPFEGTFTPFGANWSVALNTTTASYLTYGASTSASPAAQAFCVEAWVMFNSLPTTTGTNGEFNIWQKGRGGSSNYEMGFSLILNASATAYQLSFQVSSNGTSIVNANSPNLTGFGVGQWNHFAITNAAGSGVVTYWFNGTNIGTSNHGVTSIFSGTGAVGIGNNNNGGNAVWQGYISNLRVVFGSQVYTANFTPSTSPLTKIAGTNFLGCATNQFQDISNNTWAVTANGTPQVVRFNPFGDNATPYTTATYGGSTFFGGSGNTLSYASNAAFGFGTGPFTLEAWIYPIQTNSNGCAIVDLRPSVSAQSTEIAMDSSGHLFYFDGPNNTVYTDPTPLAMNQWVHVALTRDGSGVWRLFKNGVQVQTNTAADNLGTSQPILIGQSVNGSTANFTGYISNVRISNNTAFYTSGFTPSTSPLTAISGTSFLFGCTDASLNDYAMQQNLQTAGNAKISTTQQKWGSGSMSLDGSNGTWFLLPASMVPNWGSVNWTIELWFYSTVAAQNSGLVAQRTSQSNFAPILWVLNASGQIALQVSTTGSSWSTITSSTVPTTNTWHHAAIVRSGSTFTLYYDGSSIASGTISGALMSATSVPLIVGAQQSATGGSASFTGFMQDFRITFGKARYSGGSYPVPSAAFQNQ
jgi:hypothetical protein